MISKDPLADLKKLAATAALGIEQARKLLKQGKAQRIYLSSNCPAAVKNELQHAAQLAGTEVIELKHGSDEVGAACQKPFTVSVVTIRK